MISMDKIDIAKYLRDYAIMSEIIRNSPNIKIGTLYKNYMISNGRVDEYLNNSFIKMIRLYTFMTELRIFSFIEDISIDFLNENDLDFDDIKKEIFVNPEDEKKFSKKQIIRYIRNAFNHNDSDDHSKYNISFNGRFLEIHLLDVRKEKDKINNPQDKQPFHIKLDGNQLYKIRKEALKKNHNLIASCVDFDRFDYKQPFDEKNLDNLEFVRIYFNKKIDFVIIDEINNSDINSKMSFQERQNMLISILDKYNYKDYYISRYKLNDAQKKKAGALLNNIKDINVEKENEGILANTICHIFSDVIPLGMYHFDQLFYEQQFAAWFMDPKLSFNEIEHIIHNGLMRKEYIGIDSMSEEYLKFDKVRYEMLSSATDVINNFLMTRDYYSRVQYPIALYLGYISDSLNDEAEIEINDTKYDSSHIRNSFVHGRWFFGEKDSIELYDCESGNNNDYNFNWNESISLHKLLKVIDNIYISKKSSNNKRL